MAEVKEKEVVSLETVREYLQLIEEYLDSCERLVDAPGLSAEERLDMCRERLTRLKLSVEIAEKWL